MSDNEETAMKARAAAIAEELKKAGITNDNPEEDPNPYWAASEAFYIRDGSRDTNAWRELNDFLKQIPAAARYRKLASLCKVALSEPMLVDERREAITFAWGYFSAALKAEIDRVPKSDAMV